MPVVCLHRVLFRDTVTSEAMARERRHPDHDFVFRRYHPDIAIFEALSAAVAEGLRNKGEKSGRGRPESGSLRQVADRICAAALC